MGKLMTRAAKGQKAALLTLYNNNKNRVFFLAKQLLRDDRAAADITARVFRELFYKLPATEEEFSDKALARAAKLCKERKAKELVLPANQNFLIVGNFEGFSADADQVLTQFTTLQRFIFVVHTVGGYDSGWMARYFNTSPMTIGMALEAERRNIMRILQTEDTAVWEAFTHGFALADREITVPKSVDEKVENTINAITAPITKKKRTNLLLIGGSVLAAVALIVAIVLLSSGGEKEPSGLKTTGNLDGALTYYADIAIKDHGTVTVKLDQKNAPVSASNFVELARDGFYDGLTFHRIMEGFMMQGGCPNGDGYGGSDRNILGEFSANGVNNPLSHTRGAVSMARSDANNSGSSQFFIVHEDSEFLDGKYAVFGYVTSGMEFVDAICEAAEPIDGNGSIAPSAQPVIEKITIRTK